MTLDFAYIFTPDILAKFYSGFWITLRVSAISTVCAVLIGLTGAFLQAFSFLKLDKAVSGYIHLFRNTPLLIQLYFFYRGLQCIGILLPPEVCGILALTLYTGAFLIEIFRSGLLAIPAEQRDAAKALGLTSFSIYWRVLIPQAYRVVLPLLGNQLNSLVKNSSLIAFISMEDLFYVIYKGAVDDFRAMEFFLAGLLLYSILTLSVSGLIHGVEYLVKLGVFRSCSPFYMKSTKGMIVHEVP